MFIPRQSNIFHAEEEKSSPEQPGEPGEGKVKEEHLLWHCSLLCPSVRPSAAVPLSLPVSLSLVFSFSASHDTTTTRSPPASHCHPSTDTATNIGGSSHRCHLPGWGNAVPCYANHTSG